MLMNTRFVNLLSSDRNCRWLNHARRHPYITLHASTYQNFTYVYQINAHLPPIRRYIRQLYSNEQIFENAIPPYQEALEKAGYSHQLKYKPPKDPPEQQKRKNRKRNILWFNPPFSKTVIQWLGLKYYNLCKPTVCWLPRCDFWTANRPP